MLAQIVRFNSALSDAEILETYASRASRYEELEGLIQKYYMRFPATGEYGAVYLWESAQRIGTPRGPAAVTAVAARRGGSGCRASSTGCA